MSLKNVKNHRIIILEAMYKTRHFIALENGDEKNENISLSERK